MLTRCPPEPAFDIAATSGHYSQMTGVLAGFAFTAIVVLLTPTKVDELRRRSGSAPSRKAAVRSARADDGRVGVFLSLLAAFFALVVSTLLYAVLAGETQPHGRAAAQEIIVGLPFGLAVIMLLSGLALLMDAGHVPRQALTAARLIAGLVTPVLVLMYLVVGLINEYARTLPRDGIGGQRHCDGSTVVPTTGWILVAALAVVLSVAAWPSLSNEAIARWARRHRDITPLAVIAVSIGATICAALLGSAPPIAVLPRWVLLAYIVGTWLLLAVLGCLMLLSTAVSSPDIPHHHTRPRRAPRSRNRRRRSSSSI